MRYARNAFMHSKEKTRWMFSPSTYKWNEKIPGYNSLVKAVRWVLMGSWYFSLHSVQSIFLSRDIHPYILFIGTIPFMQTRRYCFYIQMLLNVISSKCMILRQRVVALPVITAAGCIWGSYFDNLKCRQPGPREYISVFVFYFCRAIIVLS